MILNILSVFSLTESFSSNLYFFVQITKLFSSWIKSTIVNHSNLSIPFNCESPERETQLSNRRNWEKHNDEHQTQTYASGISTSKAHNSTNNPSYKLVSVSLEKEFNLLHHPTYNSVMPNLISLFLRTFAIIYCTINENVTVWMYTAKVSLYNSRGEKICLIQIVASNYNLMRQNAYSFIINVI